MKTLNLLLSITILFVLSTGTAAAEARSGFGLNGGVVSHNRDCGGCIGSSTSGLSIGIDYQFALSDRWSISPFLMSSGETVKNIPDVTAGHGILGAQLRYWAGSVFFGGHVGSYSEVLNATSSISLNGSGGGAGLVAGWEERDGGFYVMGQMDSATVTYSGLSDIKFTALRLSAGYRWK